MREMKKYYKDLVNYVNKRLKEEGYNELYFDEMENIDKNLYEYPIEELLKIEDEEKFVKECFFKILDRYIDEGNYHLIEKLKSKKLSKIKIIEILYSSKERKEKFLQLKGL